ncbi:MAG: SRPBCC family protein [Bryobacteraceae bacterium]
MARSFQFSSWIDAPVSKVFAFHEHPDALERLTPPGQKLEILERTNGIQPGSRVVLRGSLGPMTMEWHARHTIYEEDSLFVDEQEKGPFKQWTHRHEFEREGRGTRLTDSIEYSMKGGPLLEFLGGWFVNYQLRKMFRWRHKVTKAFCEKA